MVLKILTSILMLYVISTQSIAEMLPNIELSGENGGRLNGKPWNSNEIKGKVFALFYVDPDEKELNSHVSEALAAQKFPKDKYGSIAIINMKATWLPNFAIASSLKEKQKKYPDTLYLKDLRKVLVEKWGLKDDSSNVLIFNKDGSLAYKVMGKLTTEQVDTMIKTIKSLI